MRKTIPYLFCLICLIFTPLSYGSATKVQLSSEEKAWLSQNHTVRVRIGSAPPFMLTDGKIRGMAIDYLTYIFNQHGVKIRYIQESEVTWPQALKYIEQHDVVDMVPTAKITDERKKHMLFTNEYIIAPWVIFTRSNADFIGSIDDLKGKTVSVEEGFVIHDLLKRNYPEINLKVVSAKLDNNFAEIPIKDLSTGLVDAYIGNLVMTTYMIQSNGYTNVKVAAPTPFENHNQAMAIRNDWPELVSIINKTLSAMSPDEHATIRNRWLSIRYEYGINKAYVAKWVLGISGVAALIVGLVLFWNRRLKTEVDYRKRIEKDLSEGRSKLKAALNSMTDAVFISDQDGQFVEFNEAFASFHRLENKTACLKALSDWPDILDVYSLDGKQIPLEMWAVSRALRGETIVNAEYRLQRKDTGETWFGSYNYAPIRDDEGRISGSVVVARDITENRNLQLKLQQAQKMESIGTLAGGIAHDFNNLLYPIIGYAEMLKEDLPPDSVDYENAQEILNAGKRGGELVKQILAFSRQADHKLKPVRAQKILKEVLKLSRSSIPSDIEIHQDIQEDCGSVMADPTQLNQIGMNLITNAYHAVEKAGGKISVQLKETIVGADELKDSSLQSGQYAMLSVSDDGIGISCNVINNIFEPYFTTKEKGKGTGLGLAVVYGIVKEYKGDITVYSEVGKGTTFNVYLPLLGKPFEADPERHGEELPKGSERILLVDDEASVAKLEKQMLERLGYKVTERVNSVDALSAFKENPFAFELVITDMTMPNMTGDRLARELMTIRSDIPIIICTGFSERINREKAESIGVKGFLMKPIVKAEMAKMVRKVLDEIEGTTQA